MAGESTQSPAATEASATECAHTYLRVRPTDDPLTGDRVTEQCEQLHGAVDATIECLLVNDPTADELRYYLGAPPETQPVLKRVLARLVPDTYAIEAVDTDPVAAVFAGHEPTDDPADGDAAQPDLAAVTFHGVGERHDDWQTRLRPPATSDVPEQHRTAQMTDAPGLPLASLVEGLQTADGLAVYQALIRPKADLGWQAERRISDLEAGRETLTGKLVETLASPPRRVSGRCRRSHRDRRCSDGSVVRGPSASRSSRRAPNPFCPRPTTEERE